MISKRVFLSSVAAMCCGLKPARSADSAYPSHPITMVLPFSAGGPTDALARIISARMQDVLGQSIVIENVTGAAGTLGVGRVVRAAADGYTISVGPMNSHVLTGAIYHLPFDLLGDLGRVEDWRASRPFDRATFPVPSTSHAACGFPALRAPIRFTPTLMGPILLGQLSARRVALCRR
jgi:hypothetical protein